MNKAIEPVIQDKILEVLPDDGKIALEVIAQLAANMVLSIPGASLEGFINSVRVQHHDYMADEA